MTGSLAADLLACYGQVEALTVRLREALDADDAAALDRLADERGAVIERAGALLAQAQTTTADSGAAAGADTEGDWDAVRAAAQRIVAADEHLRALLAARSSEIPAVLAELRGGRTVLEGYAAGPSTPESVDRRG